MLYLALAILLLGAAMGILAAFAPHGEGALALVYMIVYPTAAGLLGLAALAGGKGRPKEKWLGALGWVGGVILAPGLAGFFIFKGSHFVSYQEQQFLGNCFIVLFPNAVATVVYKIFRFRLGAEERGKLFSPRDILAGLIVVLPLLLLAYKETVMFVREKQVEAAAAAGDEDAKCKLAQWQYETADGLYLDNNDFPRALELYRKSGEAGITDAQWRLGRMYMEGKGTAPDKEQGQKWLLRAAKLGDTGAQHDLAEQDLNGDSKDYADAMYWVLLSRAYEDKVMRDIWHRLSKDQVAAVMDRVASYQPANPGKGIWCTDPIPPAPNLKAGRLRMQSFLYLYGLGVTQDETQGLLLQGQAAELGDQISQYNIGSMGEVEIRAVGEAEKKERLEREHSGDKAPR